MTHEHRAPLRVGLVGAGSMGSLHARVLATAQSTTLAWISDPDEVRGRAVAERFDAPWIPNVRFNDVDALIVAAPTEVHAALALEAIGAGRSLLLEKPLAATLDDSIAIVEAARRHNVVLMCGLLERFNPAVRTAFEIAREPLYASSVRHSPYADRVRTGVAGDLLIHDLDLMLRLFQEQPGEVSGRVGCFDGRSAPAAEDAVEAILGFTGGRYATLSASRMSQRKIRSLTITEPERLIEVDLVRHGITIYRHVSLAELDEGLGYRQQTIIDIPEMRHAGEPLRLQLDHFVDLVEGRADSRAELEGLLAPHRIVSLIVGTAQPAPTPSSRQERPHGTDDQTDIRIGEVGVDRQ